MFYRGPDSYKSLKKEFDNKQNDKNGVGVFTGAVLHLRGTNIVQQPMCDETQSNIFLWNGEIFDGSIYVESNENDTDVIFNSLKQCKNSKDLLNILRGIEGPFAFIFYSKYMNTIWFGRDRLGRRSLLFAINKQMKPENDDSNNKIKDYCQFFALSSCAHVLKDETQNISIESTDWTELPNSGVFGLNMETMEIVHYQWGENESDNGNENANKNDETKQVDQMELKESKIKSNDKCTNDSMCKDPQNEENQVKMKNDNIEQNEHKQNDLLNGLAMKSTISIADIVGKDVTKWKEKNGDHNNGINRFFQNLTYDDALNGFLNLLSESVRKRVLLPKSSKVLRHRYLIDKPQKWIEHCNIESNDDILISVNKLIETWNFQQFKESIENESSVAIFYSGGIDSQIVAALCDQFIPLSESIDLINVVIGDYPFYAPDRLTAINGFLELKHFINNKRKWRLIEVNVTLNELENERKKLFGLMHPCNTIMDFNIGNVLWHAARGIGQVCYANNMKQTVEAKVNDNDDDGNDDKAVVSSAQHMQNDTNDTLSENKNDSNEKDKETDKNVDLILDGIGDMDFDTQNENGDSENKVDDVKSENKQEKSDDNDEWLDSDINSHFGLIRYAYYDLINGKKYKLALKAIESEIAKVVEKEFKLETEHCQTNKVSRKERALLAKQKRKRCSKLRNLCIEKLKQRLNMAQNKYGDIDEILSVCDKKNETHLSKCHLYISGARVVLLGFGSDELLAGYGRHRTVYRDYGVNGLKRELNKDFERLWKRNLGRDDRIISHHSREARWPFLDEKLIDYIKLLPLNYICDLTLPTGIGDKKILRDAAKKIGLKKSWSLVKRAIQFGSRIANAKVAGYVNIAQNIDDFEIGDLVNAEMFKKYRQNDGGSRQVKETLSKKYNKSVGKPGYT